MDLENRPQGRAAKTGAASPRTEPPEHAMDQDLVRVVSAWPKLSEAIRRAILALLSAADG